MELEKKNLVELSFFSKDIVKDINSKISTLLKNKFKSLILFGSVARNNFDEFSDVDLLLITSESLTEQEKEEIAGIEMEILMSFNIYLSILIETEEFVDKYSWLPFYKNIRAEGINLYG